MLQDQLKTTRGAQESGHLSPSTPLLDDESTSDLSRKVSPNELIDAICTTPIDMLFDIRLFQNHDFSARAAEHAPELGNNPKRDNQRHIGYDRKNGQADR